MVLQRFFSGSLGWLRCYIAPLLYKELLSPFKGSLRAKEPLLVLFSTIFVEEIQCNMAPLMVLHSTIWQRYCSTFKDMVLYSTKSGSPMITSQEPLLVLYSTIFFFECTTNSEVEEMICSCSAWTETATSISHATLKSIKTMFTVWIVWWS